MMILGHLGFGLKLSRVFFGTRIKNLPHLFPLLLGTLLPDLIDKPLYYGLSWWTGSSGAGIGLISGTRTFGHTALFLIAISLSSRLLKSPKLLALAVGIATHLLIDHLGDTLGYAIWPAPGVAIQSFDGHSLSTVGLLWPFLGNHFLVIPFENGMQHAMTVKRPHILIGEILGFLFLIRDQRIRARLWKRAYSPSRRKSSS